MLGAECPPTFNNHLELVGLVKMRFGYRAGRLFDKKSLREAIIVNLITFEIMTAYWRSTNITGQLVISVIYLHCASRRLSFYGRFSV
tara:strand:- start:411 stop:671 length:261 start_codon:yes stop_codon:yes gene_type:complete